MVNLADVMDQVATQLDTISGLRVMAWPAGSVSPPTAIVGYPDKYDFDAAYGRGADIISLPVVVVCGRATDRTARDAIGAYANGSGASSVKAVVEAGTYTAFDTVRVTGVDFDIYTEAGVSYLAAIFTLDIAG